MAGVQGDAHVEVVGFDVTALPVEVLAGRGIRFAASAYIAVREGDAGWILHAEFTSRFDDERVERAIARRAAADHFRAHGTVEGLVLARSFPCEGMFRVQLDTGKGPVVVQCDRCGKEVGIQRTQFERAVIDSLPPAGATEDADGYAVF